MDEVSDDSSAAGMVEQNKPIVTSDNTSADKQDQPSQYDGDKQDEQDEKPHDEQEDQVIDFTPKQTADGASSSLTLMDDMMDEDVFKVTEHKMYTDTAKSYFDANAEWFKEKFNFDTIEDIDPDDYGKKKVSVTLLAAIVRERIAKDDLDAAGDNDEEEESEEDDDDDYLNEVEYDPKFDFKPKKHGKKTNLLQINAGGLQQMFDTESHELTMLRTQVSEFKEEDKLSGYNKFKEMANANQLTVRAHAINRFS